MHLRDYLAADPANPIHVADFAQQVGVDRTTVLRWAAGDMVPSPKLLGKIYNATKGAVTPSDMIPISKDGAAA